MAKILKPPGKFKILAILAGLNGESPLELIEKAGRTAYQSHHKISPGSAEKFIEMLRKLGHESVLEHSAMTVRFFDVSRGFTHQLVRHRLASYTQESTRYVDKRQLGLIIPPHKEASESIKISLPDGKQASLTLQDWFNLNEQVYRELRNKGWAAQDARQVLPIATSTEIVTTANFREWKRIFELRCAPDAHWEIRLTMVQLLKTVQKLIPVIFDDFKISEDETYATLEGS
ncbi:MAG: FAD-dependent thymidylate synthase [Candidatus Pacebacteria bacterium]|nr:FAD-dependent thymidylate synthase [Candidatus Paceibacterota bacterium]